jgi:hypothetical protein
MSEGIYKQKYLKMPASVSVCFFARRLYGNVARISLWSVRDPRFGRMCQKSHTFPLCVYSIRALKAALSPDGTVVVW